MARPLYYAFCYCEENVYKFLEMISAMGDLFDRSCAVFMTSFCCAPCDEALNEWTSVVPYRPYESSELRKDITTWDYHVIALVRATRTGKWYVVDQDSRLPPTWDAELGSLAPHCIDLDKYVAQVLFLDTAVTNAVCSELTELLNRVRYRVIERDDYLSFLRSDRSHMQKDPGVYRALPPQWPLINGCSTCVGDEVRRRAESALSALPSTLRANNLVCFINAANTTIPGIFFDSYQKKALYLSAMESTFRKVTEMHQRTDGTSGYFNDVPYFTPVETAVFYEAVRSCRLHRLPAHLMVKPISIPFFTNSDSALARALEKTNADRKGKLKVESSAPLPTFTTDHSANQMLFKASGKDYVSLREVCNIFDASTRTTESNTVDINSLNNEAINKVWTELLLFLNSCSGSVGRFVVHNIDTLCSMSDGSCEFLVSLLLAGVASILRYYSHIGDRETLLNSVSVEFTVLNTELGSRVADSLQFFVERGLRLTVSRSREDNFKAAYDQLISSIPCIEFSDADWMDAICGEIVDAHEMLCDRDIDAAGSGSFISPIVLLIAPPGPSLRVALEKQILDSYSSEALRVQSDGEWVNAQFDKKAPLVFICSSYWLVEQMSMPKGDGLLHRLNVQIIVHGGFCEIGDSAEEEILRCVIALRSCGIQWEEMRVMQHKEPSYWRLEEPVTFRSNNALAQECANVLLLLFRRFLTPYSPFSKQPYTSLPRDIFCSRRGWDFYHRLTQTLRLAGVLAPEAAAPFETIELTVLGRFLSYRFRIGEGALIGDTLTVTDGKAILWAFLFRQPLNVPLDVIKSCHAFDSWVDAAVANFCKVYRLGFEPEASTPRKALVAQLALFGIGDCAVRDRVHYLLSSPNGVRFPLRQHLVTAAPTNCRGWYEQAPLNAGLALERKEVNVFCLPPQSAYCELEAVEKGSSFHIQCPMELSYPLIVTHSVLHISLHNVCVFSETADPSVVTPLPAHLLESGVMSSLLCEVTRGNAGFWLDGVMNEIVLASSASSVLAPLTLQGRQYIPYCERELFTRKRLRQEREAVKAAKSEEFKGTLPRTAAERSAVEELAELIRTIGREKAEKAVRGKKGFSFLEPSHELYPFYLYNLKL